jgi:UDP-GlcNAc:undecaprenyl-phosphate GlcNAc-1-phosphate transferase
VPLAYVVGIAFAAAGLLCWIAATFAGRGLHGRVGGHEPGLERRPPRLGGLAVLFATGIAARVAGLEMPAGVLPLLPWILGMYALGALDDVFDLPPRLKFFGQAVVCLALTAHVSFNPISSPDGRGFDLGPLAVPWTALWLLLVVNAVNFTDGADGLAGGFVVLVSAAIALLARARNHADLAPWLAIYAGAHAGFLLLNWRPARLYLGDAGSLGAGLVLALAGIVGTNIPGGTVGLHTNSMLFWLPLTEMALTVGRRFVRGQPLARGDDRHIHHMLVVSGRRPDHAVGMLLALAGLTALAAYVSAGWRSLPVSVLVAGLVFATVVGVTALGYVEFRVVRDRIVRLAMHSRRRGRTLVRIAETAQRVRRARNVEEVEAALQVLVEEGVLDRAALVRRGPAGDDRPIRGWSLDASLGPPEAPGYSLEVRSREDERFPVRPDDLKTYLVPAVDAAMARLAVPRGSLPRLEQQHP